MVVFNTRQTGYRNQCVPMPRELDCEMDLIFDTTGQYPRRSMHDIVYVPVNGESIREVCAGMRLTAIGVLEDQEGIGVDDRLAVHGPTRRDPSSPFQPRPVRPVGDGAGAAH